MQKTYTERFLIRSYQADVTNHFRPGAVLEIMQEMAGAHAEMLGIGRTLLLVKNMIWVLSRVEVRLERYPLAGETIVVETFPMPNRRFFFPRYFIFRDEGGRQIGCAGSAWVLLDVNERRMCSPDAVKGLMPDNSDLTAPLGFPATVDTAGDTLQTAEYMPRYTDLDCNGHVNNTRYLDWACNALGVEAMKQHELRSFALNFNRELLPGQCVTTVLRRDGARFSFSGSCGDTNMFDVGGELAARE